MEYQKIALIHLVPLLSLLQTLAAAMEILFPRQCSTILLKPATLIIQHLNKSGNLNVIAYDCVYEVTYGEMFARLCVCVIVTGKTEGGERKKENLKKFLRAIEDIQYQTFQFYSQCRQT